MDEIEQMLERQKQLEALKKFRDAPIYRCSKGSVCFTRVVIMKAIENTLPVEQDALFCIKCNKLHPWCVNIGNIPKENISDCEISEHENGMKLI